MQPSLTPYFSFKKSIYRAAYILRMFSEAFLTKNAWPGNISMASAKKSNFFLFMVVHTNISYISLNFTHMILHTFLHFENIKDASLKWHKFPIKICSCLTKYLLNVEVITIYILKFVNDEKMLPDKYHKRLYSFRKYSVHCIIYFNRKIPRQIFGFNFLKMIL